MKLFPKIPAFYVPIKAEVLILSSALMLGSAAMAMAESVVTPIPSDPTNIAASHPSSNLADGIYLYGDSPEKNQVSQGYVVFKKQGQTVTGAFYYPQSEFTCFTGTVKNQRLDVLSLGLPHENAIEIEVPLGTMHPIKALGNSEQNSLSMCQQEVAAYQKQQQIATPITPWTTP